MCDYSLHDVASRPAKVGDKLVTTPMVPWNLFRGPHREQARFLRTDNRLLAATDHLANVEPVAQERCGRTPPASAA
jgi:hypothetical protein